MDRRSPADICPRPPPGGPPLDEDEEEEDDTEDVDDRRLLLVMEPSHEYRSNENRKHQK